MIKGEETGRLETAAAGGRDSKVWFWLVSTREAYAELNETKRDAGRTKETAGDINRVLLSFFIIHLTYN